MRPAAQLAHAFATFDDSNSLVVTRPPPLSRRAVVRVAIVALIRSNKASILFRLQSDEWEQTTAMLRGMLEGRQRPPLDRLRVLVHAFKATLSALGKEFSQSRRGAAEIAASPDAMADMFCAHLASL